MPKDKTLLHDTSTAKVQPHSDEVPKDKTRDTPTAKIQKPDEVSKDKTRLQDTPTYKTHPHKSYEKIEVHDILHIYTYIYYDYIFKIYFF